MNIINTLDQKQKNACLHKHLNKGEILFHENDRCEAIGIMLEGKISIESYLEDGTPVIYNQLEEDEIFGNNLVFSSHPYYKGSVIALKDCHIVLIKKDDLLKILQENSVFLEYYLQIQSDFGKKLNDTIRLLSIGKAEERFFYYLRTRHDRIAYSSISDLARSLHMQRETLSRLIHRLIKEKKITMVNNIIEICNIIK